MQCSFGLPLGCTFWVYHSGGNSALFIYDFPFFPVCRLIRFNSTSSENCTVPYLMLGLLSLVVPLLKPPDLHTGFVFTVSGVVVLITYNSRFKVYGLGFFFVYLKQFVWDGCL